MQSNPENNKRFVLSKEKLNENEWDDTEEPYIKKWIDYSNKYGIGYILSTNACGVYFNDNSKIILASDFLTLTYIEKGLDKQESTEYYSMKNYPPEIKKKVTLLIHFKNYMDGNQNKTEIP
jgi:polo-like kinase 1